jgi:predicted transposase YdaD
MRNKIDQEALERMFAMYQDIIQESWVYQQIVEQGIEKGIEQGIGTGLMQGEQRALFTIIEKRFPEIADSARQLVGNITDASRLETLIGELSVAQTAQEALGILSTQ